MHVLKKSGNLRLRLGVSGVLLALGGCLESPVVGGAVEPDVAGQRITLSGSVGDGPVIRAAMVATSADQRILAEFESTMQGGYSVALDVANSDFPLIVTAIGGTDLVTNLQTDFDLSGAVLA